MPLFKFKFIYCLALNCVTSSVSVFWQDAATGSEDERRDSHSVPERGRGGREAAGGEGAGRGERPRRERDDGAAFRGTQRTDRGH